MTNETIPCGGRCINVGRGNGISTEGVREGDILIFSVPGVERRELVTGVDKREITIIGRGLLDMCTYRGTYSENIPAIPASTCHMVALRGSKEYIEDIQRLKGAGM